MDRLAALHFIDALVAERLAFWQGRDLGELQAAFPGDLAWIAQQAREQAIEESHIEEALRNVTLSLKVDGRALFPA